MVVNGATCGVNRSQHRYMLSHVVSCHEDVARACIKFACWQCKNVFTNQKKLDAHTNKACKAKRKALKRKASSESTEADSGKSDKRQKEDEQKEDEHKTTDAETKCCGYNFSGRLWNYERHRHSRHGIGSFS